MNIFFYYFITYHTTLIQKNYYILIYFFSTKPFLFSLYFLSIFPFSLLTHSLLPTKQSLIPSLVPNIG